MTWRIFFNVSGRDRPRKTSRLKSLPTSLEGDFSSHHASSCGAASAASRFCFSKSD